MSRSTRAITQIALALVLSLAAAFMVFRWMAQQQPKGVKEAAPTYHVIASAELKKGMKIGPEAIVLRGKADETTPPDIFLSTGPVVGRVLARDIAEGAPITASSLEPLNLVVSGVSAMITPGKRAMAVKGNPVMGLSGFVLPGDRVDVLVSLTKGSDEKPVTKLVLERVRVLATGTELSSPKGDGKTASVDVYTLELTPEEGERLALAATRGTLHFALRNGDDDETVLTAGSTVESTLAAYRKPAPRRKVQRRNRVSVEVITGGERTKMKF
ncbi:Flp pilus assembly protein CpaB [Salidesulfovibrio brasiliensis]|uniref:Flp pilus assembly protein CpaB n=1 Tax=Salidesulfovibrio brasiliensis TaxID=221711 RepID=UPI0006D0CD69|nr:Flp pilus assembly protein CpaB [Salidesulfovibrio brasiliensis]